MIKNKNLLITGFVKESINYIKILNLTTKKQVIMWFDDFIKIYEVILNGNHI